MLRAVGVEHHGAVAVAVRVGVLPAVHRPGAGFGCVEGNPVVAPALRDQAIARGRVGHVVRAVGIDARRRAIGPRIAREQVRVRNPVHRPAAGPRRDVHVPEHGLGLGARVVPHAARERAVELPGHRVLALDKRSVTRAAVHRVADAELAVGAREHVGRIGQGIHAVIACIRHGLELDDGRVAVDRHVEVLDARQRRHARPASAAHGRRHAPAVHVSPLPAPHACASAPVSRQSA